MHMSITVLKVSKIGNSRGIRLPAAMLRKYRITDSVTAEETADEIILRPTSPSVQKLSWEATAAAMSASKEDWSVWEATIGDGLNEL
jgi:antitoxin MazE